MAWLYFPGSAASVPPSTSPSPPSAISVTWRGKLLPPRGWSRLWKRASFLKLLSGMTSPPSTADPGVDSWISSTVAPPANPTPSPAPAAAMPTNATSGPPSSESSKTSLPPWSSSKTSQASLPGFDLSANDYANWVSNLRLDYSARQNAALRRSGNDYSSWPTPELGMNRGSRAAWMEQNPKAGRDLLTESERWPTPYAQDDNKSPEAHLAMKARMKGRPRNTITSLQVKSQVWQTPATDSFRSRGLDRKNEMGLDQQSRFWRTPDSPNSSAGPRNRQSSIGFGHQITIAEQAEHWPTPGSNDFKGSSKPGQRRGQLDEAAEQLFPSSPQVPPTPPHGALFSTAGPTSPRLWKTPHGFANTDKTGKTAGAAGEMAKQPVNWPTPRAEDSEQTGPHRGSPDTLTSAVRTTGKRKLNTRFVFWLQGMPPNWASPEQISCAALETWFQACRARLPSLLSLSVPK